MRPKSPILRRATSRPVPGKGPRRPEEASLVKKGFLGGGGGGGASSKRAAAAERPDLTVVRKAEGADPLMLPDVQKSMDEQAANSSAANVGGGGAPNWVTPALLQQIAADPLLRKAFTDPQHGAMLKPAEPSRGFGQLALKHGPLQHGPPARDQGRAAPILGQPRPIGILSRLAGQTSLGPHIGAARRWRRCSKTPRRPWRPTATCPRRALTPLSSCTLQPPAAPCHPCRPAHSCASPRLPR